MLEINMHRGDYLKTTLNILDSSSNYSEINFDEIYFTVKKNANKIDYEFQKTLSSGKIEQIGDGLYTIEILPEDTDNLMFGEYIFDIELIENNIPIKQTELGKLILKEEVTYALNELEEEDADE